MVEHTGTAADEPIAPDAEPAPHANFEELVAEPERVVREAAAHPVRTDGPNGETLVLVDAAFDRPSRPRPRARHASEWTAQELELLRA